MLSRASVTANSSVFSAGGVSSTRRASKWDTAVEVSPQHLSRYFVRACHFGSNPIFRLHRYWRNTAATSWFYATLYAPRSSGRKNLRRSSWVAHFRVTFRNISYHDDNEWSSSHHMAVSRPASPGRMGSVGANNPHSR